MGWLFAYLCAGAEFTWIALYVLHFAPDFGIGPISLAFVTRYGFAPACLMKNIVNLCQFASAAQNLAIRDTQQRKNAVDPVLRTERRAQPQGSPRRLIQTLRYPPLPAPSSAGRSPPC